MNIPNFVKKVNSWSLKDVKESLHVLSDTEDRYLSDIFLCKENISKCLAELLSADKCEWEWTESQIQSKKNLINNLNMKSKDLFEKFFMNYCFNRFSIEELRAEMWKYGGKMNKFDGESLLNYYKDMNLDLSHMVFESMWPNDILKFMKDVKSNPTLLNSLISDFLQGNVLSHVWKALLSHIDKLKKWWNEIFETVKMTLFNDDLDEVDKFYNNTIYSIKNDTLKIIWDEISQKIDALLLKNDDISFWDFVILMSVASTQAFIKDYYMKLFADTLVDYLKANYHYDSTENWNNKSVVKNKFEFDDPGKLEVLSREIIKEMWYHGDLYDLEHKIVSDNNSKVVDMWIKKLYSIVDYDEARYINDCFVNERMKSEESEGEYANKLYEKYQSQFYELLVNWFIRRAKDYFRRNLSNLDLSKDEREEIKMSMESQYPEASKKIWWSIMSNTKWKNLKQDFVNKNIDIVVSNMWDILDQHKSEIASCSFTDIVTLFAVALSVIPDIDLNFKDKLIDFSKARLWDLFEEDKKKQDKIKLNNQLKQENLVSKKDEEKLEEKAENSVIERNTLPEGMNEELVAYFWHDIDQRLDRYLRNAGGVYKTIRFKDYDVNEEFFEILENFGFSCIDEENWDEENTTVSVLDENNEVEEKEDSNESTESVRLKEILNEVEMVETIEEKANLFVDGFKLYYDIFDEQSFRNSMMEYCRDNKEIFNAIWSLLDMISKWKREIVKTSKSREWKYFKFNVWRTWYRIAIQNQKWSNKRIIIDFCDHDTYESHCDFYYNFSI